MMIFERLKIEFSAISFKPVDFELSIGGEEIPPYSLPLEEGNISVYGSIDRVDLMEKDGIKYIRVIDYKTGTKEFKLANLFSGINLQMVLYLMALNKNGGDYYGDIVPAGVLYLPSRIGIKDYLKMRNPSDKHVEAQKSFSGKLSGMVLNSPVVLNGMGVDKLYNYLPVSYDKKNNISGNYYFISEFVLMQSAMGDNYNTIDKDGDGEGNALAPANDYQYSEIRKYIDGDMLTKFSMKNIVDVYATQRVLESEAGYMYNSASGMYDSVTIMENCTSKMWILSETESYFLPEGNLAASTGGTRGTTYPKAVSTGYWWLRSQGQLSSSTYKYVDTSGSLNWNNLTCMYGLRTAFQYTIAEGTI